RSNPVGDAIRPWPPVTSCDLATLTASWHEPGFPICASSAAYTCTRLHLHTSVLGTQPIARLTGADRRQNHRRCADGPAAPDALSSPVESWPRESSVHHRGTEHPRLHARSLESRFRRFPAGQPAALRSFPHAILLAQAMNRASTAAFLLVPLGLLEVEL